MLSTHVKFSLLTPNSNVPNIPAYHDKTIWKLGLNTLDKLTLIAYSAVDKNF